MMYMNKTKIRKNLMTMKYYTVKLLVILIIILLL